MENEDRFFMVSREMLQLSESILQCSAVMKEIAEFIEEMNVRVCALEAFHERKE